MISEKHTHNITSTVAVCQYRMSGNRTVSLLLCIPLPIVLALCCKSSEFSVDCTVLRTAPLAVSHTRTTIPDTAAGEVSFAFGHRVSSSAARRSRAAPRSRSALSVNCAYSSTCLLRNLSFAFAAPYANARARS